MNGLDSAWVADLVVRALDEDLGGPARRWRRGTGGSPIGRDVTSEATIPRDQVDVAHVVARADGVLAGIGLWPAVLAEAARRLWLAAPTTDPRTADGERVRRGDVLARLEGPAQVLLLAERTALNLCCRASGVATHTRAWADALEGTGAQVLDTRKTTPGLRALEKYAVRCGGGTNKRMGLFDVAMIKDNHKLAAGSITAAWHAVRQAFPALEVQVEVTTVAEALEAVGVGARFLLCDNMSVAQLGQTVQAVRAATPDRVELEATGGLTLARARDYALTGVDYLSVGGLTHSSPALDIALDLVPRG